MRAVPGIVVAALALGGCGRIGFSGSDADPADLIDADPNAPDARLIDAEPLVCGNGLCEEANDETCATCDDCATGAVVCGNGLCQAGENGTGCLYDCGPAPWPVEWETAAADLAGEINMRRTTGGQCPMMGNLPGVGQVATETGLRRIARSHSWDYSAHDYLPSEPRCAGPTIFAVMEAEGYNGARGAAFYAGGDGTATPVFDWFINDEGLCPMLMNAVYTEIGVAMAHDAGGIPVWTVVLH